MEYTKNYKLPQWVETDRILMGDFNQAMADIDAGLKAVRSEATEEIQTLAENLNTISANLGDSGKNCRIVWGTYTGTGKSGSANLTRLTPGFCPVLAMVGSPNDAAVYGWPTTMIRGCTKANGVSVYGHDIIVNWSDTAVSWYSENAEFQMNLSGTAYYYVVLGYDN